MANPKYQSLPYIASGEPDVYESGDLPESDQILADEEPTETVVERVAVDPKASFRKFNKSTIDTSHSDFSDSVGKTAGRSGYDVQYEVLPTEERADETVVQKLQRLKCEIRELEDAAKTNFNEPDLAPAAILTEVEQMQEHIEGVAAITSSFQTDRTGDNYIQLLSHLKSSPQKSGSPEKGGQKGQPGTVTYELHYKPDVVGRTKLASLDTRLTQLEQLLGKHSDKLSALTDVGNSTSLMDTVAELSAKLQLTDGDKVDKLAARLQLLLQSMENVQKSSPPESRNMEVVNELYDMVKRWDSQIDSLPQIVDRMYTLQDLHQQAMEFSSSLKALETAQAELAQNLTGHTELLKSVQTNFGDNVDIIKENVGNLEKRMAALNK